MEFPLIVLVVADLTQRSVLEHLLRRQGFEVASHGGGGAFREAARGALPGAVLLDAGLPEVRRGSLVRWIRRLLPRTPLVLLHEGGTARLSAELPWMGSATSLAPLEPGPELLHVLRGALDASRLAQRVRSLERANGGAAWGGVVGCSPSVRGLEDRLDRVAASEVTVHLYGEPGVGKRLVAQALHSHSGRRDGPLVFLDCSEAHERRAVEPGWGGEGTSDPTTRSSGVVERAMGGTLVLRGLAALEPQGQAALLERVGSRQRTPSGESRPEEDYRLVLIHRDPPSDGAGDGRLQEDLPPALGGVEVCVPPLRERPEDILLLVDHFTRAEAPDRMPIQVTKEAAERLLAYPWPGNVRELSQVVRRALLTCDHDIALEDLPESIRRGSGPDRRAGEEALLPPETLDLRDLERWAIRRAVAASGGNMTEAATLLGIGRTTLYRKLDAYGLR